MLIEKHEPDAVLLDLYMPKFELERDFRLLRKKHPEEIFIAYTADEDANLVERCRALGFSGYIFKTRGFLAIRQDIENILNGARVFPQVDQISSTDTCGLTEMQREIIRLMASGCKNAEIAKLLNIREATVDYHKRILKDTLGANTSAEVVAIAKARACI